MGSRLLPAAAAAVLFVISTPAFAIETVTLPQNPDGTPDFQNPAAQADQGGSKFSTDRDGAMKVEGLGTFHFSASQDPTWPGDPDNRFRMGTSSASPSGNAYGDAKIPGSEFYNPFGR